MGKTTAKYLSIAKAVRVIIEQAIDDPCERRSSLQEICPKRPSFTHEWMPRNILIAVGIILKMAMNRSPTYEHHHHRHHVSIVLPPPPPPHFYCFPSTTTTTTILLFSLWWWRENNRNVVAVAEGKQWKCGGGGGGGKTIEIRRRRRESIKIVKLWRRE